MATKTVAEKLQIKPSMTVWTSSPEHIQRIGTLPAGAARVDAIDKAEAAIIFVNGAAAAREALDGARDGLTVPKILWVAYPKANKADINRDTLWPIVGDYGLRPVSQVAIDDTWSALRFRPLKPGEKQFTGGKDAEPAPSDLPKLAAPAQRALPGAGIASLSDLSRHTEAEVASLHGMRPKALDNLRQALGRAGLAFAGS